MPNIERARRIEGWMSEPELLWLAEQAEKHKVIVEIGSYLGRSTRALADNTPGAVYALDDWYGPRDFELTAEQRRLIPLRFCDHMHGLLLTKVRPVVVDHANLCVDIRPDMVFIDGDHEYGNVLRDIQYWKHMLSSGGLLCGHDWDVFPGVNQAVTELLPGASVAPNTNIWYAEI